MSNLERKRDALSGNEDKLKTSLLANPWQIAVIIRSEKKIPALVTPSYDNLYDDHSIAVSPINSKT